MKTQKQQKMMFECEMCTKKMKERESWHPLSNTILCGNCYTVMDEYLHKCSRMLIYKEKKEEDV